MNDNERDPFHTQPLPAPNEPEVLILESDRPGGPFAGVKIKAIDEGYSIISERDYPVIEYDRSRYRLERDPASSEQVERFKIVPKGN